jgi:hypothetical protein
MWGNHQREVVELKEKDRTKETSNTDRWHIIEED